MAGSASLDDARAALDAGQWETALAGFERALAVRRNGELLEGLSRTLWWLRKPQAALDLRTQAYAAYLKEGRAALAVRAAVWLSREYRGLQRNEPAANGWLARAITVAASHELERETGWLQLARSEAPDVGAREGLRLSTEALATARAGRDPDLEVAALARTGFLEITLGIVPAGLRHLDEALAAATSGEPRDPQYVGEAFCALLESAALLGDLGRIGQWASTLTEFRDQYDYLPLAAHAGTTTSQALVAYCGSCCGTVYLVTGRLDEAERQLTAAVRQLEAAGLHSRCVHPATQLAQLRLAQGRFEDAQHLLEPYQDLPECTHALASLELALQRPASAVARLGEGLERLDDRPLSGLPMWTLMVEALLAVGDLEAAAAAVVRIDRVAALTGSPLHRTQGTLARGQVAAARGDPEAPALLRSAARGFGDLSLTLYACRARLAYARAVAATDPGMAIAEAQASQRALERLGARRDADAASALLRELGVRGRTGPRELSLLSRRERDVLTLVSRGLSNAEIAERLFISTRTAGHHVSSILTKLRVRSRTEAAAFAAVHLGSEMGTSPDAQPAAFRDGGVRSNR